MPRTVGAEDQEGGCAAIVGIRVREQTHISAGEARRGSHGAIPKQKLAR